MQAQLDLPSERVLAARDKVLSELMSKRVEAGHWIGELSSSALSTATAISALSFFLKAPENKTVDRQLKQQIASQIDAGLTFLATQQNEDGGFGDTDLNYSNISTSMLVVAAIHSADAADQHAALLKKTEGYIELQGGVEGLRRRYGIDKTFAVPILANCAMAGQVPWKEVSSLPFEAACVPQTFYRWMQLPVVSYAIPALVAIGQAKLFHDPPRWNLPARLIRKLSIKRSLAVLKRMQPASGGFLEAVPLTSFVVMGLSTTGRANHSVVESGVRFLVESFRNDGSWPIDTNLATWNTTLSLNAIATGLGQSTVEEYTDIQLQCFKTCASESLDWILSCQNTTVHPFTGAKPGGWGWSDLSGAVPDADDTPGALIALKHILNYGDISSSDKTRIRQAAELGIDWLLRLQNRDKGWPTFCRGWGKLPFDRSGADITAHVLRALHAWENEFTAVHKNESSGSLRLAHRIERAISSGLNYIYRQQRVDGSWLPLWFGNQDMPNEENPVYGTAKILMALHVVEEHKSEATQTGLKWLIANQNSDNGWGGGASMRAVMGKRSSSDGTGEIDSSVEETALALETLISMADLTDYRESVNNGIKWLVTAIEQEQFCNVSPIGFYFAKLWYHERLYPIIFTMAAMNSVVGVLLNHNPDRE